MPVSSQKIVAPVSIADVQQVLGLGANYSDVEAVCKAPNINPWAKFKPVRTSDKFYTSQFDYTNNKWKSDADWWKAGSYQMIGSINPYFTQFQFTTANLTYLKNKYNGGMNGWTYYQPNSVYRLMDFAGYNHNAPAPIYGFTMSQSITQSGRLWAQIQITYDGSGSADSITIGDFSSSMFGSLYFGLLITNSNDTPVLIATDTVTGGGTVNRTFEGSGEILAVGTYKAYPILINRSLFTSSLDRSGESLVVCTCPYTSPITFNIIPDSANANVTVEFTPNLSQQNYGQFTIVNDENLPITGIQYMFTNSASNPATSAQGWQNWTPSTTIAANSSAFKNMSYAGYTYLHIWFKKNGNGEYHKHVYISAITPPSPQ